MKIAAVLLTILLAAPATAHAYLHLFVNASSGGTVALKWEDVTVRWFATNRGVPGVSASDFQAAMARAFTTWQDVETASVSFEFVGFTSAEPFEDDGISVLGFQNEPDMERVLGATGFLIDVVTGEILESDVFFNSTFQWSTAAGGETDRVDLQSVALHEIGHFIGLGHSALGETELQPAGGRRVLAAGAVMFPIAFSRGNTLGRQLHPDDIAGVSDLYPDGNFLERTGVAQGRIVRNGVGVLGAHVVAFNPRTGELIGGFTLNRDGDFQIAGLTPGAHVIRVEPLDDADIESFFSARDPIDIAFQVTFHDRLAVVPAGGAGDEFTVSVRPR
jgi:hypothetical protein